MIASARVDPPWDLAAWRTAARALLRAGHAPESVTWLAGNEGGLFDTSEASPDDMAGANADAATIAVPREFLTLAGSVICHRDPHRLALLYRMLWRISHGERHLLDIATDADTRAAMALAREVQRDSHKMKAFVRFRQVPGDDEQYIAWFEPQHHIVDRVAPFFARRFTGMRWAILTPYRSVQWDGEALCFGPGAHAADAPADDATESLWQTYYANIFNPARLNPRMMQQEMPQHYWRNLPEAQLLPGLIRDAGTRVQAMADRPAQAPTRRIPVAAPDPASIDLPLDQLRRALDDCRRCPLWQPATQVVPGSGPADARVMVIGEQPGDHEDLTGRPFVGPAGNVFDAALRELGIDRGQLYLTNAVKHFRFRPNGKHRLHQRPTIAHLLACRPWLQAELEQLQPERVVLLGATAVRAVLGMDASMGTLRGRWFPVQGTRAFVTVHPSSILRLPDAERPPAFDAFRDDLRLAFAGFAPGGNSPPDA